MEGEEGAEEEEEQDEHRGLMELMVVFDGGSRGNPGQGHRLVPGAVALDANL